MKHILFSKNLIVVRGLYCYLFLLLFLSLSCTKKSPTLTIGLVADPQYANKPSKGKRHYRESLWKLKEAIDSFNDHQVDFIQNLGDIIDDDWESFDSILPVYDHLDSKIENYHLLGNHEFSVDSSYLKGLVEKLSMPDFYYSYSKKGWRFIVLDVTDYSYYSNSLHNYDVNEIHNYFNYTLGKQNNYRWNSAIGLEQQQWIKDELCYANLLDQKVVFFSHMPIRPKDNPHNLWNDFEIIDLIENHPKVVAFINGHNHSGDYTFRNGIHYITVFGMVDTTISSYGILELFDNQLILKGFGNQKSFHLYYR